MSARLFAWTRIESPGQKVSFSLTGCHCASAARFASTMPWTETALAGAGSQGLPGEAPWAWTPPTGSIVATVTVSICNAARNRARPMQGVRSSMAPPLSSGTLHMRRTRVKPLAARSSQRDSLIFRPRRTCRLRRREWRSSGRLLDDVREHQVVAAHIEVVVVEVLLAAGLHA